MRCDEAEIRELAGADVPTPPPDSALDYLRSVLDPKVPAPRPPVARLARMSMAPPEAPSAFSAPNVLAERLGDVSASTPATVSAAAPLPSIERSQWERIVLAADVELHIRRPLSRAQNKQVDRLVTIARELLEEDRS